MSSSPVSDSDVERSFLQLKEEAEAGGYHLNPDGDFTRNLIRGLLKNDQRYSYRACPCRLATGRTSEDLDIVCPCDYRDADISEFGACYCALYVSAEIARGEKQAGPVPERRPPRALRGKQSAEKVVTTGPVPALPLPVWRCKVCGYLCARELPPATCPICKVGKERFERFM